MKLHFVFLAAVCAVSVASHAQAPQAALPRATLTETNVLLKQAKLDANELSACQPLAGEVVEIIEVKTMIEGMKGLDAAKVNVIEGRCAGQQGWVGTARLKAAK